MPTTTTIKKQAKLGDVYARNMQWSDASSTFTKALDQLYEEQTTTCAKAISLSGQELATLTKLAEATTSQHNAGAVRTDDKDFNTGKVALAKLRVKLWKNLPQQAKGDEWQQAEYASSFQSPDCTHWTIVFHGQKQYLCTIEKRTSLTVRLPRGSSIAYVVDVASRQARALDKGTAKQLSYLWAHLAQADVKAIMPQYYVHQILSNEGATAVEDAAIYYRHALALRPRYTWALAHLGEVYREIANGWADDALLGQLRTKRGENYLKALLYFHMGIEAAAKNGKTDSEAVGEIAVATNSASNNDDHGNDHDYAWACAHLGATIVNARAFMGWDNTEPKFHGAAFKPCDLDEAIEYLVRAQEINGYYYPWAQDYYGGALLLRAVLSPDKIVKGQMGILSMLHMSTALYLQPELLTSVFEPGQLYVNPFFEISLLVMNNERHSLAWQYAWIGMKWSFKFNFLPGLQRLIGCTILAHLAFGFQKKQKQKRQHKQPKLIENSGLGELIICDFAIPKRPIEDPDALTQFIDDVFTKVCEPLVKPFLTREINTKIRMGLMATAFILKTFLEILDCSDGNRSSRDKGNGNKSKLYQSIKRRLSEIDVVVNADITVDPERLARDLLVLLETGMPMVTTFQARPSRVTKRGFSRPTEAP